MNYFVDFINLHAYFQGDISFERTEQLLQESLIQAQKHNSQLYIVFLDVHEGRIYDNNSYQKFIDIDNLCQKYNLGYNLILDIQHKHLQPKYLENFTKIIWLDWFVIFNYIYNFKSETQVTNKVWNHTTDKGLFTPGKIDRLHRINLMLKLWQNKLLDKLIWSFSPSHQEIKNARKMISSVNDKEFNQFLCESKRTLDVGMTNPNENWNHAGYPYDVLLYKKTSFSIVSESDFYAFLEQNSMGEWVPKFTEKTFRAVANNHPIIFNYFPGIVERFEQKGYKSFKEYLKIPEYNDIKNDKKRIQATIENIKYFTNSIELHRDKILNDVKHNFKLFMDTYNTEILKLSHLYELPNENELVRITPEDFVYRNWYSSFGHFKLQKVIF